jgi:hypothetical protein
MSHRNVLLFVLCIPPILLLGGCLPNRQFVIPVTGEETAPVPALVEMAEENVLEYLISSSRLAIAPPGTDWQLDDGERPEDEYRFHSGDWLMVVWFDDAADAKQRVVIINKVEKASWCGYVESDGKVVDTSYTR